MPRFQPEEILRVLVEEGVEFIIIGGIAATLHGSHLRTGDLDICPKRGKVNLGRLARALERLDARVRAAGIPDGLPFAIDATFLSDVELFSLVTRFGDFDLCFMPQGTAGFADLEQSALVFDLDGLEVPVASLEDVICSKEAADRPKDRGQLPTLRALLEETANE